MGKSESKSVISKQVSQTATNVKASVSLAAHPKAILQNYILIWLDPNIDTSEPDFQSSLQELRYVVTTINTFTDAEKCIDFLQHVKTERVFMILSETLGRHIVPRIERFEQLESIYILDSNVAKNMQWCHVFLKVRGVYKNIKRICESLQNDCKFCDQNLISMSFNNSPALFMYTQVLKEAILEIEDDDEKSIKDLVQFCRQQNDIDQRKITEIELEYRKHTPIWWYTKESFIYRIVNHGLQVMDTDIILKMGVFIRHLHNHIRDLHQQQKGLPQTKTKGKFTVYRGQGLPPDAFEKMKNSRKGLMSFNNFLSTSSNRTISLNFAEQTAENMIPILFVMSIDCEICDKWNIPFADITDVSFYKTDNAEILFSTHTVFRIENIQRLEDSRSGRVQEVQLTLTSTEDHTLKQEITSLRQGTWDKGWAGVGYLLLKIGEPIKAKEIYMMLLQQATNDTDKSQYMYQLGTINRDLDENGKALSFFEEALEIKKKIVATNDFSLVPYYYNIAEIHNNIGNYSKALENYMADLNIREKALPMNHPDLAILYNSVGAVYDNMGEYSKALESYEKSLEIRKIALPPNHPDLAASYNNLGSVYNSMGEYSKALESYENSLEIRKRNLLPINPVLDVPYYNIGLVHYNMREYSKALACFEKSLEIRKITLPPNHPDLAASSNKIGLVHEYLRDYRKALSYYQKAREIRLAAFPSTHPLIAEVKKNIDRVKSKI